MLSGFVGRGRELGLLAKRLERASGSGRGVAVAIRGRRQVGKSRLVQEFCNRADVPYLFFTATKGTSPVEAVTAFGGELRDSSLCRDRDLVPDLPSGSWPDALRILAAALPDGPSIVVIDETPWLSEQDPVFDGALQTAWDRLLAPRPVLLLLLGSDLHMMARLTAYDRPFYGRADNLVLGPLNPAETGLALGLAPADALDAHLVSGGLPGVLRAWPHGTPALAFMEQECLDPASALFGVPAAALLGEFPQPDQSRRVLEAVGSGERTHANIAAVAGARNSPLASGTLSPLLARLTEDKQVLAMDVPLSTQPGRPALYRVTDSNLRLYLAVLRAAQALVQRDRSDDAFRIIQRRWTSWRGKSIEPLVREALGLAAASDALPWPQTQVVGGWWNRQFDPEVDLVGADRSPVASRLYFTGTIKWLASPFDQHDLAAYHAAAVQVPGFVPGSTGSVAVCLSGVSSGIGPAAVDLVWGPAEIVAAWR